MNEPYLVSIITFLYNNMCGDRTQSLMLIKYHYKIIIHIWSYRSTSNLDIVSKVNLFTKFDSNYEKLLDTIDSKFYEELKECCSKWCAITVLLLSRDKLILQVKE